MTITWLPAASAARARPAAKRSRSMLRELKKFAGVLCTHCTAGKGCTIYGNWLQLCRDFHCAWRAMGYLGDEWRPDRCGVLIGIVGEGEGIPPEFRQVALKFDVYPIRRRRDLGPADQIHRCLNSSGGIPAFLGIPTPVGFERRKVSE